MKKILSFLYLKTKKLLTLDYLGPEGRSLAEVRSLCSLTGESFGPFQRKSVVTCHEI